ncbi:hypothetical protein MMA231_01338 [Asticcacaulis sp. MM231]|uniref:hypothetical protein n=1 Tax=Asticcacaulis sp. MM231 TaxID=3157666 RepID=UPI0032D588C9
MALDDRTAQEQLSPEERRGLLRAFADRMLLKITAMDDPEDMPGVERAVRVAAVIERLYSRCDRAERHAPDPRKIEAERATHEIEAIKARVSLANTLEWGEKRRRDLGQWWDAAQNATTTIPQDHNRPVKPIQKVAETPAPQIAVVQEAPAGILGDAAEAASVTSKVTYVDYTDGIEAARADLALQRRTAAKSAQASRPPFRGPP